MTMHDYKLICPAYTLFTDGAPCERCKGGAFFNATVHACVKDSRAKSALCTVEAYLHQALGVYRRNVAAFIAPSRFLAAKAAEFGVDPARITYIPNWVETSDAVAPGDGSYVLYAGRLERVKGVSTLIEAYGRSALKATHELVLAGDGESRTEFEALATRSPGKVRFTGHLGARELRELIDGAAFVVAPSEWYENAPLSVLEAAGRGKAVVVTSLGGLPELVRKGETGLIVPPRDPVALAAAMDDLAADPVRTVEMGRNARTFVKETFSAERHYEQIAALYDRLLTQQPHP
jgi:glycosyltransferase involved in cell wall biosynthesis